MASLHPPPSVTMNNMDGTDWRNIGIHRYQVCEIMGSKDLNYGPITQTEDMHDYNEGFYPSGCTGSGPLFDIYLVNGGATSGVNNVRVGDILVIEDDTGNDVDTDDISFYRYDIVDILDNFSNAFGSGYFEVKYVSDSLGQGEQSPCDLYTNYAAHGYGVAAFGFRAAVFRPLNVGFLFGGL